MKRTTLSLFQKLTLLFVPILLSLGLKSNAQGPPYLSTCETVPFACPSVCIEGTITLKIFQVQRLGVNARVQAELSDANGNYGTGSRFLEVAEYSTNGGSTYTPGPYTFSGDRSDLFAKFKIPAGTQPGANYNLRITSSLRNVNGDNFRCPGAGRITIMQGGQTLPPVAQNASGDGKWIGHVYSWNPTTGNQLTTDALVNAQDFFNASRYQGHTVYNNLSLDLVFSETGGVPGSTHNGTSMACGSTLANNFSMRLKRMENFAPGRYQFAIAGDDGIRFSIDGGATWLLSSFYDQLWSSSWDSSATGHPNGICLSGPTELVIEYFQHPIDARLTFRARRVDPPIRQPEDFTFCQWTTQVSFQYGFNDPTSQYQWQVSTDLGVTFQNIQDGPQYSGTNTGTLVVLNPTAAMSGHRYRCLMTSSCLGQSTSDIATLSMGETVNITSHPQDQITCSGQPVQFSVGASGVQGSEWEADTGNGLFKSVNGWPGFTGGRNSLLLTIQNPTPNMDGWIFRCGVVHIGGACIRDIESNPARLTVKPGLEVSRQPQDIEMCDQPVVFEVSSTGTGANFRWQVSRDRGVSWTDVPNTAPYSGASTPSLTVSEMPQGLDTALFRVVLNSSHCQIDVMTLPARLTHCCTAGITQQPTDKEICGNPVEFLVISSNGNAAFSWQVSTDGGQTWSDVSDTGPYSGSLTGKLTVSTIPEGSEAVQFRAQVRGGRCDAFTAPVKLTRCCVIPKEVPHILTVNDDALNNMLGKIDCPVTGFSMKVYNRWGKQVFTSITATAGWEARDTPAGTYFYRLTYVYQGQATAQTGFVEVVR